MSDLRADNKGMKKSENLIAMFVADLHLSLTQPACRADKDWMTVQRHYLEQLAVIADDVPILCAGDIFDKWNPPPELITFALKYLPSGMICVPGQHDLPNHRTEDVHRSGYGVLVEAQKIRDASRIEIQVGDTFVVYGFGWERKIEPIKKQYANPKATFPLNIALIHRYCWTQDAMYPGAPNEGHVSAFAKALAGYDIAVFGDNHKHFKKSLKTGTVIYNCGGFIRRKSDERNYKPCVGLLYEDGRVESLHLDTNDRFHENVKDDATALDIGDFVKGLKCLGEQGLNFEESVKQYLAANADIEPGVKAKVLEALKGTK